MRNFFISNANPSLHLLQGLPGIQLARLKILQHKILFILVDLHHRIPFFL
jgi:hypothetical protein